VGDIDPDTGYVYDMKLLSDLIKENVLNRFDHKNLNLDTDEFSNLSIQLRKTLLWLFGIF
jgi:6-pyruvoyltetrahydropterin/6-carboxytetrahydropterin synthase